MEELKELFGDGALTMDEFTAKLTEKGIKLADISKGGYIAKEKFDRQKAEFEKYKSDNDVSKYADYDEVVKERNLLRAEKEEAALAEKVKAANVSDPFRKFVLSEVRAKVTKENTFDKSLEAYLAANPQYIESQQQNPIIRIPSQVAGDKGAGGGQTTNAIMNEKLRSAVNKKNQ